MLVRKHAEMRNSDDFVESKHCSNKNDKSSDTWQTCKRRDALAGGTMLVVCTTGRYSRNSRYPCSRWKRDGTAVASELATEWSVTDGESELLIRNDGTINLSGPHPSERKQNLSLKLPDQALVGPARGFTGPPGAPDGVALSVEWPGGIQLHVWRASTMNSRRLEDKFSSWAHSIDQGYLLEFVLQKESLTKQSCVCDAEIALELCDGITGLEEPTCCANSGH